MMMRISTPMPSGARDAPCACALELTRAVRRSDDEAEVLWRAVRPRAGHDTQQRQVLLQRQLREGEQHLADEVALVQRVAEARRVQFERLGGGRSRVWGRC